MSSDVKFFYYVPKLFGTKFQNNSSPGIFLGYIDNPTAYKILNKTNNKIIISRNVEFFEFTPGNSHLSYCDNDISNFIPNNIIRSNDNTYFYNNTYDINHGKDFDNINNNIPYYQYNNNKSNNIQILDHNSQINKNK